MPEYTWPSKVKRYGIQCPFQRFLVAKYESIIDWNGDRIESPDALDRHIRGTMLPALRRRIDPASPKSLYCREVSLAQMLANPAPAPHLAEVRRIRDQRGDDAARAFLLDRINRHKQDAFEAWWTYLAEGNPVYAGQPAFQYLILRPILDSSDAKCTRSPVNLDAEALARVFDGIRNNQIAPTERLLRVLCEFMAFGRRAGTERPSFGTACGWVAVTKKMDKAADRVAALSQGSGWCVASPSMAAGYLRHSDFHLLVEGGRAMAAVRTSQGRAVEIEGRGNRDPGPWWPRILLYCAARGLRIEHRTAEANAFAAACRKRIASMDTVKDLSRLLAEHPAQVQFVPDEVANDEGFRPVIETAWLSCVKADPLSSALAPSWMARTGEWDATMVEGWRSLLNVDPYSVLSMPPFLQHRTELAAERALCWTLVLVESPGRIAECPPDLDHDPEILSARRAGWLSLVERKPDEVSGCPADLQSDPEVRAAWKAGWIRLLERSPDEWADCPADVQGDPAVRAAWKAGWIRLLGEDPLKYARCPEALREDADVNTAWIDGWIRRIRHRRPDLTKCPRILRGHPRVKAAMAETWKRLIREDVTQIISRACPEQVARPVLAGMRPADESWFVPLVVQKLQANPRLLFCVPRWLASIPRVAEAIRAAKAGWPGYWARIMTGDEPRHTSGFFERIPASLRNHPELLAVHRRNWQSRCVRRPDLCAGCPPGLLEQGSGIEQAVIAYFRRPASAKLRRARYLRLLHAWERAWGKGHFVCRYLAWNERALAPRPSEAVELPARRLPGGAVDALDSGPGAPAALRAMDWAAADGKAREAVLSVLRHNPARLDGASNSIRDAPEAIDLVKQGWRDRVCARPESMREVPPFVANDPGFQREVISFWAQPAHTKDFLWSDWMHCPDFVKSDAAIARRAVVPIVRALRRAPSTWLKIVSPWREMDDLRREAADSWASCPVHATREPPADIREIVAERLGA